MFEKMLEERAAKRLADAAEEATEQEAAATRSLPKQALNLFGMHDKGSVWKAINGHHPRPAADEPKDSRKHKTDSDESAPNSRRHSDGDDPTQGA